MFKRFIIMIIAGLGILATWIVAFSVVIILVFTSRHPDHCMAEYFNFFLPENVVYQCQ